jgi:hypothetical protein
MSQTEVGQPESVEPEVVEQGAPVNENPDRVDTFKSEIDGLKLRGSGAEGERRLLLLGGLALAAGIVLTIIGGIQVTNNTGPADQRAFMATGTFLGIALIIAGAALFVRYSLSRYLRFWLIRLIHESRANTDRIVEAIERAGRSDGS